MYHPRLPILPLLIAIIISVASTAEAATRTWNTGAGNGFFSNPANWEGLVAPVDGDDLVFPDAPVTPLVNDIPNLRVNSFTVIGQYSLSGQPIFLGAGGFRRGRLGGSGILWINLLLTLEAHQTWDATGLGVAVQGEMRLAGHTLTVEGDTAAVQVEGTITGSGNLVMNWGRLVLTTANSFIGQTIINGGEVFVSHANGLGISDGTLANGTIVTDGQGTLVLGTVALANEYIRVSGRGYATRGALQTNGAPSFTGPIELVGDVLAGIEGTGTMTFAGPISGNGRLILGGSQHYVLANSGNSFTGGVQFGQNAFAAPSLRVAAQNAIPGKQVIELKAGSVFQVDVNGQDISSITGNGSVIVSPFSTIYFNGSGESVFHGALSGTGVLYVNGSVHQTFTNPGSGFTGNLFVLKGTVTLTNPVPTTRAQVESGGRLSLKENGGVGYLLVLLGSLQVSEGGAATGSTGELEMRPEATLEVGGSLPAALGKLTVNGTVDFQNNRLNLALPEGFSPTLGQAFTIVDNNDVDPIKGTFAGLPEGATFTSRGVTFSISYAGGTGNDVVLDGDEPRARVLPLRRRDRLVLHHRHPDRESESAARARHRHVPEERRHDASSSTTTSRRSRTGR